MPLKNKAKSFAELARQYCTWVEGKPGVPDEECEQARKILAALYLAALDLPEAEPEDDSESDGSDGGYIEWYRKIHSRFAGLPFQFYHVFFDPIADSEEPVKADIADDLAGIYGDLKQGLTCWENGEIGNAVFEWEFGFSSHWGRHAVGALRALHCYLVDPDRIEFD